MSAQTQSRNLLSDISNSLTGEFHFLSEFKIEWLVVFFAVGIGIYFWLPFEPKLWVVVVSIVFLLLFALRISNSLVIIILIMLLSGIGRSTWHSKALNTVTLPKADRAYTVTGWIKAVEKPSSRFRWLIKVEVIEGLNSKNTPKYIRTTVYDNSYKVGDQIKITSVLSAPPFPAIPGGYDTARAAYFREIGGYGYAISRAQKAEFNIQNKFEKIQRRVAQYRFSLAERILEKSPSDTAGLQVALLTGIRSYIPQDQTDTLRVAGLAHVLAISGLHMGLVAGSVYYLATLFFACIIPLSRRMDIRKISAAVGIFAALSYLILSGASVATQRAFIIAVLVFLAVILDRRAFSLRSVAIAAFITLMWHPEVLLSAGFQMSFAAVTALVVVYRNWDKYRSYDHNPTMISRGWKSISSLTLTSLVAGLATAGFAAIHFNRMATYGLLGNVIAMPVFTFWVMPAALAVFVAFPLGLEEMPLLVMGRGLEILLELSNWVAGLNGAITYVTSPPAWLIGGYGVAFTSLCLGRIALRYLAAIIMVICFLSWLQQPLPNMRISSEGQVSFWQNGRLLTSSRSDRFGREQFMRQSASLDQEVRNYSEGFASCDDLGCLLDVKGKTISVVNHPSEVPLSCHDSHMVILTKRSAGPVAKRACEAILIDETSFKQDGAYNVYISKTAIRLKPSITQKRRNRPWG